MDKLSRDKFWQEVQTPTTQEELADSEKEQLRLLLTSKVFKLALSIVWDEARGSATKMLSLNLATPAGINQAAQMQGKALGMTRVLDGMLDLVEDEEGENDA